MGSLLERRLRCTFVDAPGALPSRPEPREAFDNAARRTQPSNPWRSFGLPLRATARAARALGGTAIVETRTRIIITVLAFLAWILEPLEDEMPLDEILFIHLVTEQAEAVEAQMRARGLGTAEARAVAVRETEDAIAVQQLYVGQFRRPMGVPGSLELVR